VQNPLRACNNLCDRSKKPFSFSWLCPQLLFLIYSLWAFFYLLLLTSFVQNSPAMM